jgi:thiamine kinase-like enzyme
MIPSEDNLKVIELLNNLEVDLNNFSMKSIGIGKNNRTYLAYTHKKKYLAKFYFSSPKDQRNRLSNEYSFLKYVKEMGIVNVPRPIIKSDLYNLGIYEFIEGRAFSSSDINEASILAAANFFSSINNSNNIKKAKQLNYAADAFLDLNIYINQIDERIFTLESLISKQAQSSQANVFMRDLFHVWSKLKINLKGHTSLINDNNTLCVSPSDFGFHNTLIKNDQLFFVDFEYAGRDDPAKALADFFIQPEINVPTDYMNLFADKALDFFEDKEVIIKRAKLLYPLFQVKWCCIIMNEFMPEIAKRRLFSNPELNIEQSKNQQLKKAQKLLLEIK